MNEFLNPCSHSQPLSPDIYNIIDVSNKEFFDDVGKTEWNFGTFSGEKEIKIHTRKRYSSYVFEYRTENNGKILIALCKNEKPLLFG